MMQVKIMIPTFFFLKALTVVLQFAMNFHKTFLVFELFFNDCLLGRELYFRKVYDGKRFDFRKCLRVERLSIEC
jgi:hypothetical protein